MGTNGNFTGDNHPKVGIGDIFRGISNLISLVGELGEEGKTEIFRTGEITGNGNKELRGIYGLQVKLGINEKHEIKSPMEGKKPGKSIIVQETTEPVTDIFDEGEELLLIIEMPGVEQDHIYLDIKEDIIIISADAKDRRYAGEVLLPSVVNPGTVKTSCNAGVLEIRMVKENR